jgi:hypothetical protein
MLVELGLGLVLFVLTHTDHRLYNIDYCMIQRPIL